MQKSHESRFSSDVHLNKSLAWILRHGAARVGLPIGSDGFLELDAVLAHQTFNNYAISDVQRIVANDPKNRYTLIQDAAGAYKIKANQGHSIEKVNELNLRKITNLQDAPPIVVHGTYRKFWPKIQAEGLRRMKRNHIHFSCEDQPAPAQKISGFRESSEILIYLNVEKTLAAGIEIFISENNVILSAGQNGIIKREFFEKVVDRKTKKQLDF